MMKLHTTLLLFIFFISSTFISAQDYPKLDVIYLKNKQIYRGTILSDEFGVIKLQTTNTEGESTIVTIQRFEIKSVERNQDPKTIKEKDLPSSSLTPNSSSTTNPTGLKNSDDSNLFLERQVMKKEGPIPTFNPTPTFQPKLTKKGGAGAAEYYNVYKSNPLRKPPRIWIRDIRGFRGFLEAGYMWSVGKNKYSYVEFSKSIGFQFTPFFYLGVGASAHLSNSFDVSGGYPLFINPRFNLTDRNSWNPFISLKGGYSVGDMHGINTSVTTGSSIVLKNKKLAFNVGITYTYFAARFKEWDITTKMNIRHKPDLHSIGVKIELEYFIGR